MAPKMFWERIKGKRHPGFKQRMGFNLPKPDRPVIWIHGVSVGEIKAAGPLMQALKSNDYFFFITTTTATGYSEAKRSLAGADAFSYFPIDFSWVARRFAKALKPVHFILIEGDFWPNLLKELKKNGTVLSLVSGKISEKSASRFRMFPKFSKRLFSLFDHICVQNSEYFKRFLPFVDPSRLKITGNLKLDIQPQDVSRKFPFFDRVDPAITISCTHAPEEAMILDVLANGPWTLVLAPRHPERFNEVAALLEKKKLAYSRWSCCRSEKWESQNNDTQKKSKSKVILVDQMGELPFFYAHSRLSIVGGSFVEGIGGHNILEPCLYGTPVFFGEYTNKQIEFVGRVLDSGAGRQISIADLRKEVDEFFSNTQIEQSLREGAKKAFEGCKGATQKSLEAIGKSS